MYMTKFVLTFFTSVLPITFCSRIFDIFLFDPQNRKVWKEPNVLDKELTPIVIVQDKLEGTGWGYADELETKYRFQIRSTKAPTK